MSRGAEFNFTVPARPDSAACILAAASYDHDDGREPGILGSARLREGCDDD